MRRALRSCPNKPVADCAHRYYSDRRGQPGDLEDFLFVPDRLLRLRGLGGPASLKHYLLSTSSKQLLSRVLPWQLFGRARLPNDTN